jgi:hypothetical protein
MSSKEKESKHHHHRGGRVSVKQAKKEIKRWKERFAEFAEPGVEPPYDFVKAFFIPMHDIKRLYENYKDLEPTGVRAYIGITDKDENGCAPLRLLLVPAKKHTDFYDHHEFCADKSEDELDADDVGNSSIYDFTMPCPDVCATHDPLGS